MKKALIFFLFIYIFFFIVDYMIIKKKLKKRKWKNISGYFYLTEKFHLKKSEIPEKVIRVFIPLIDAFIVANVTTCIADLQVHYFLKLLIAFVLLFLEIYVFYEILGRYLKQKKKRGKKNESN